MVLEKKNLGKFDIESEIGDWIDPLKTFLTSDYIQHLNVFLSEKYNQSYPVYPSRNLIFEAFKTAKFEDLKMVFVNEKPHQGEHSSGLGMGIDPIKSTTIPFNLKSLEKCIYKTIYNNAVHSFFDYTLEEYAEQGILMLNTSMTCQIGSDHSKIWKNFIRETIFAINKYSKNVVFVFLLKNENNDYFKSLIDENKHFILENKNYIIYEDSDVFLKADELISDHRESYDQISW